MATVKVEPERATEWRCLLNRVFGINDPKELTGSQAWQAYELLKATIRGKDPVELEKRKKEIADWLEV